MITIVTSLQTNDLSAQCKTLGTDSQY